MFYCDECAEKNGYPQSIIRSKGPCELCDRVANCSDMPSSSLPKPEEKLDKHIEIGLAMGGPPAEGKPLKEPEDLFSRFAGTALFPKENIDKLKKIQEVEKIAWQIFLSRSGLSFKRELTPDEKKQITNVDSYAFYVEQAEKIYEKRQRAILNKKYPTIDIPSDGKRGMSGGAYCLCFVYSKYKGNFVLKGYMREVEEYLKKNYTYYFCNYSLWHLGQNRDIWHFWKKDIAIFDVSIKDRKKGKKSEIRPWSDSEPDEEIREAKTFKFRRLPKRWIPEFDKL
jgi:hypothetical protein